MSLTRTINEIINYRLGHLGQFPDNNILTYGSNDVPGVTDMSGPLQAVINATANSGFGDIIIPRGVYNIADNIYFHYDATNNPDYPSTSGLGGGVNLVGEGWQDYTNHVNNHPQGTILNVGANQFKIGDGSQASRGVRFRNFTTTGNSTAPLIKYNAASRGCGMTDFTVFQDGIGGGVEMNDTFLVVVDNAFAASTNGSTTGTGWYLHNSSVASGIYELREVSARDFAKNWVIGEEGTSASAMSGVHMVACQGKGGQYNLIIGNGVKASTIEEFHNEGATTIGVLVAWGATNIRFEAMYSSAAGASADYVSLGQNTGSNPADFCKNVSIRNSQFVDVKNVGVRIFTSSSAANREVSLCTFTGDTGTETAIDLENADQHGVRIGPNNYTSIATEVSNPTRADIIQADGTFGIITQQNPLALISTLDLGHATDTTLSRLSAGVVGVEGVALATGNSGVYTPTLTNVANLDGSTAFECQYSQVGSTVTVSGKVSVDPTTTLTLTQLGISLPIASNFGAQEDCGGVAFASGIASQGAAIRGDAANNRAEMVWIAADVTNQPMYFNFSYQVI